LSPSKVLLGKDKGEYSTDIPPFKRLFIFE
jgi:hypothetical protein